MCEFLISYNQLIHFMIKKSLLEGLNEGKRCEFHKPFQKPFDHYVHPLILHEHLLCISTIILWSLTTYNLHLKLYDYYYILRHKIFHSYAFYHILSAYSLVYAIYIKNFKIYYFKG